MARKKTGTITLGESCDIVDHTPCDYKVAVSLAAETAQRYGLASYPKLKAIQDKGTVTKTEASRVLHTWAKQLTSSPKVPSDQKTWADVVLKQL